MTIDVHVHHLAQSPSNGGHIHPSFENSYRIRFYLQSIGVLNWQDAFLGRMPTKERLDALYREKLIERVDESSLDHAVILAYDGVYDESGRFDPERTKKSVTNDAVIELCKSSPKMLLGASINPARRDWSDELEKCLEAGAVLLKWLPNTMGFDPIAPSYLPFYKRLREVGMPILMHVGFEYAMPNIDIQFSGLDRLERVLKTGVTVIAAHCCGGRVIWDSGRLFDDMKALVIKYPNLYLDVAALASFHRKSRFLNCLRDEVVRERLIFATDYPIPNHAWAFRKELRRHGSDPNKPPLNYFERDLLIKEATGLPEEALNRGYAVIAPRLSSAGVILPQHYHCSCAH